MRNDSSYDYILNYIIDKHIRNYRQEFHFYRNYSLLRAIWNVDIAATKSRLQKEIIFTIWDRLNYICDFDSDKNFVQKVMSDEEVPIDRQMHLRIQQFLNDIELDYKLEHFRLDQEIEWWQIYKTDPPCRSM